MVSLSEGSKMK